MPTEPRLRRILDRARELREEWVHLLTRLVLIESPSTAPETQSEIQSVVRDALESLDFRVRHLSGRRTGGVLLACPKRRKMKSVLERNPIQLMVGHTDTVWPPGTLATMPVRIEGDRFSGPGSFDMKAGIVSMIFALRILDELEIEPEVVPWVFLNSDEEIGSPESRSHLRRVAKRACRALILEPSYGNQGRLKTGRRGTGEFRARIAGRAAHAGLDPGEGASAIAELAHLIETLHGLSRPERGIHVNVGKVEGGTRSNVIAAQAIALVDVRVETAEDAEWITDRIRSLTPSVPGCVLRIEGEIDRPPMERTERNQGLWRAAGEIGAVLGIELEEAFVGGASDGNLTSPLTATLDGLGAVGDGAHAIHEFVKIDRSIERCALLAGLLLLPATPTPSE